MTTVGVLSLKRRYWQCRCGTAGAYAADAVLGLSQRFSKVVQKHCCSLAADVSFAKASEHLCQMLGVRLAPETVRVLVASHGKTMAAFQPKDDATARTFRQAKGEIAFGSQIRSYVFQPYTLVREERDGIDVKTPAVKDVLDGDFDQFMHAFLRHKTARANRQKAK